MLAKIGSRLSCPFSSIREIMLSRRRKSTNDYLMVKETAEDLLAFISSFKVSTVWKFQDFCITQILREINFMDSRSAKSAIFTNSEPLIVPKWHICTYRISKIDFT